MGWSWTFGLLRKHLRHGSVHCKGGGDGVAEGETIIHRQHAHEEALGLGYSDLSKLEVVRIKA
jgi:hypothetical protein